MNRLILNIALLLLALLGATSCNIKEDMSNCTGRMILDYSAYSDVILDDIADDEQIDVFIFDERGICIDILSFTYGSLSKAGLEFRLPITYRGYKAVVWQGLGSDKYTSNRMKLGESYTNFYLRLLYDAANMCYSYVPDPLWVAPIEPIDFCAKITRHRVHMTRLHTEIHVSVQHRLSDGTLVDLAVGEFMPTITAANNVYRTDYKVSGQSVELEYTNEDDVSTISNTHVCSCVGTLRITPDMDCDMEVRYSDGEKISIGGNEKLDLVKYMLDTKSDDTLSPQEFLDRNKVWNINIIVDKKPGVGYIALGIEINGWVKWFFDSDLS